ncbi:MAG: hypothetical protein WAK31_23465 [Chthoniobacterales bacterium]
MRSGVQALVTRTFHTAIRKLPSVIKWFGETAVLCAVVPFLTDAVNLGIESHPEVSDFWCPISSLKIAAKERKERKKGPRMHTDEREGRQTNRR